ncbi:unnamed protein product [Heterobilharzia americana]|nr:unnamed protein product [Heterobilharzia americana]CAH8624402.1 unnamed protein product [Heterobilharzia americana]
MLVLGQHLLMLHGSLRMGFEGLSNSVTRDDSRHGSESKPVATMLRPSCFIWYQKVTLSTSDFTGIDLLSLRHPLDLECVDDNVLLGEDTDKIREFLSTLRRSQSMSGMSFVPVKCKLMFPD